MAKYIKHKSNYIKTVRHQFLKGGSTILERDWVTVGSQLNFGPGKIPYYRDGNFIFTTSPIPQYQKKYKNGVTVATWTYEDVKDATEKVNRISFDEYSEDIRSFAYYGSCVELLRSTIEKIIYEFPGNITVSDEEIGVFRTVEEFVCGGENSEEKYERVKKDGNLCFTLKNPFDINIFLKDIQLTQYDNILRYLTYSYDKYEVSKDGGNTFRDITSYNVVMRKMYEKTASPCVETKKSLVGSVTFNKNDQTKRVSLSKGNYFIRVNGSEKLNRWDNVCYKSTDSKSFSISENVKNVKTDANGNVMLVISDTEQQQIDGVRFTEGTLKIDFYKEVKIQREYKYYQMFDDEEYERSYKSGGWDESTCVMDFWLPDSVFLNRCDQYQQNILYSEITGLGENQPVYTVTINNDIIIEGYIYNKQVVPLVTNRNIVIQPKKEVIEEYFNNLRGFERQLLTRKTKPLYTNNFITPIEYNLGYLYYKRKYTWPSNGYCIDITSPLYIDFVNRLSDMAELYDELWTDNLWRRMTHEAIKNYDWTYTREFKQGDEEDNVEGGERMHKLINVIGRVFDDIKLTIDSIKRQNKVTYNADRNIPNALISDKLGLFGWDIYSTIPTYEETVQSSTNTVSASEDTITDGFLDNIENQTYEYPWYPTLDPNRMTFSDIDNEFMRRLLLSTRRIYETKGTRQSIDMIMGMFGYGNMNEECYSVTEEYYSAKPLEYDTVADNETGETLGDRIVRLNSIKEKQLIYDEDASGIPVGSFVKFVEGNPVTYLIPFYNQEKIYDGDFCFQSKGGWLYNGNYNGNEPDPYKWTETFSYLHVVPQVKDLLTVNPNSLEEGDIYYVANINDYIENSEEELHSRFFVLTDKFNPENFDSWENLNLEEDSEYVKKARYLDSIIPYTIGNNPHVGYGHYDMGGEYFEYMKKPFKYSIETNGFERLDDKNAADDIEFEIRRSTAEDAIDKIKLIEDVSISNYYLNCKVIHFKNLIDNSFYKSYFKNVMLHYLMQVIPSTSIFVLEGFE